MKKSLRIFSIALVLVMALSLMFTGCSSRPEEDGSTGHDAAKPNSEETEKQKNKDGDTTLSVFMTVSDQSLQNILEEIAGEFEAQNPGVNVEFNFPGQQYENMLKIKMAANDLPDVFDTHGWAIIRYGKYLADLRNEKWAPNLTDTIKDVVTDKDGKVHALVLTEAKDGIIYNEGMLEQYNIEVPKTLDEMIAAAEKLKKESNGKIAPFYFSGIDEWMIGQYFDYFATSLLISPEENHADELLDGSFDWKNWTPLPEKFLEIYKKGLMNEDVLTAKYSDFAQRFADGKVAFGMFGLAVADEIKKINPDIKIGLMPVPAMVPGDEPTFSGGERWTMGVWKDSKNLDLAKKLVDFYAQTDNMTKFANATKLPPGLKGIKTTHEYSKYYEKYSNIRVFPYFDRVYLPNGMWDVMCKSGTQLLAGTMTPEEYSETMKKEVERLRKQQ